jgi:hypothetical protein
MPRTYLRIAALLLGMMALCPRTSISAQSTFDAVTLLNDVRVLSDDALGGRLIGTPGADSAATFLARRFRQAGLRAAPGGWFQLFTVAREAPAAIQAGIGGATGRNVIGVLPGRDQELRNEIVVVGAHYDHLGPGAFGALDPDSTGHIHNGADDNASGASALIHIARQLARTPPARTVVFIAFSGEEAGLLGSDFYVVGRLRNDRLLVYGSSTAAEFPALLDSVNSEAHFNLSYSGDGWGRSDQSSFYGAGLPVLHLFTDLHEDYHRTTDDWEKINADGLGQVANFAARLVRTLADRAAPLTFINAPEPVAAGTPTASSGYGAYLGTIPDMSGTARGVRLTGVRAGSPAELGGLRGDDIITRIGEREVMDLQAMTDALRSHQPGDVVEIHVLRGGTEQRIMITLGRRGG